METVIICGADPEPAFIRELIEKEDKIVFLLKDDLKLEPYSEFESCMEFSILLQSVAANPSAVKTTIETVLPSTIYYMKKNREIDVELIVLKFLIKTIEKQIRPKLIEVKKCQNN